jgi:hypothetical protein
MENINETNWRKYAQKWERNQLDEDEIVELFQYIVDENLLQTLPEYYEDMAFEIANLGRLEMDIDATEDDRMDGVHDIIEDSVENLSRAEYNIESLKQFADLRAIDNIESIQQEIRGLSERLRAIRV